jgi:ATP-dependent DNA ligase
MPPAPHQPLPRVAPIVPVSRPAPFNDPAWLFEPKYDSFRGLFYLTRRGRTMYSKRGNRFSRFPELCEWIRMELGGRRSFWTAKWWRSTIRGGWTSGA